MKKFTLHFIAAILLIALLPGYVAAQTLVLIPGFQSQGMDWRTSQVAAALQERGWVDGGNFTLTRKGMVNPVKLKERPDKVFYSVDLVTEDKIAEQASMLQAYLQAIYALRDLSLIHI